MHLLYLCILTMCSDNEVTPRFSAYASIHSSSTDGYCQLIRFVRVPHVAPGPGLPVDPWPRAPELRTSGPLCPSGTRGGNTILAQQILLRVPFLTKLPKNRPSLTNNGHFSPVKSFERRLYTTYHV